jgi:membrane protease YdiL (CAAX protease family)
MQPDPHDTSPVDPSLPASPEVQEEPAIQPARPQREPFWGYDDLALVVGLIIAGLVLVGVAVGITAVFVPSLRTDPTPVLLPSNLAVYLFVYIAFRLVLGLRYGRPVFSSLGWRRTNVNLLVAGGGGVGLAFALSAFASLVKTPKIPLPFEQMINSPWSFALFAVMAAAIAPIFEELFFRGFVQPLLSRTFGVVAGILITAALFGALHAPEYSDAWQYALVVALAGAAFGWLRERTKSIIPGTVMHGCFNAVSVIALVVSKHTKG